MDYLEVPLFLETSEASSLAPEAPLGLHLDLEPQRSQPPSTGPRAHRAGKHQEYHDAATEAGFRWSNWLFSHVFLVFGGEILKHQLNQQFFIHVFHGLETGWVWSRLEDLAADAKGPKAPPSPARESRGSLVSPARWSERLDVNTKRLAKILRSCAVDESSDSS